MASSKENKPHKNLLNTARDYALERLNKRLEKKLSDLRDNKKVSVVEKSDKINPTSIHRQYEKHQYCKVDTDCKMKCISLADHETYLNSENFQSNEIKEKTSENDYNNCNANQLNISKTVTSEESFYISKEKEKSRSINYGKKKTISFKHSVDSLDIDADDYLTADEEDYPEKKAMLSESHSNGKLHNETSNNIKSVDFHKKIDGNEDDKKNNNIEEGLKIETDTPKSNVDISGYIQKKSLAQGMMDLALVSANTNQLRYILEFREHHPYFITSLSLVIASLLLQLAVGLSLIWNTKFNVKKSKEMREADRVNNFSVVGIFMITLINVFLSTFGGAPQSGESVIPKNETISTSTMSVIESTIEPTIGE